MARFDLHKLREIADEGIARHGLRGYARKLGPALGAITPLGRVVWTGTLLAENSHKI